MPANFRLRALALRHQRLHERGRDEQHHRGHEQQRHDELDLRGGARGLVAQPSRVLAPRLRGEALERGRERGAVAVGAADRGGQRGDLRQRAARARAARAPAPAGRPSSSSRAARRSSPPSRPPRRRPTSPSARPVSSPAWTATRSRSSTSATSRASAAARRRARRASTTSGARNPAPGAARSATGGEPAGRRGRERQREQHAGDGAAGLHGEDVGDADPGGAPAAASRAPMSPGCRRRPARRPSAPSRRASARPRPPGRPARTAPRRGQLGERHGEQRAGERGEDDVTRAPSPAGARQHERRDLQHAQPARRAPPGSAR